MKTIKLLNGELAFVDDVDFERLNQFQWRLHVKGYPVRWITETKQTRFMHQELLPSFPGFKPDHKDRNKLNNQRSNLHVVTEGQNAQNGEHPKNTSGFRGVCLNYNGKWKAQITKDGRNEHLGVFTTKEDAAYAYDLKALEYFGKDACMNFPSSRNGVWLFIQEQRAVKQMA